MKRHRRITPFVLAAALLMLVGLGAYPGETSFVMWRPMEEQMKEWCEDTENAFGFCGDVDCRSEAEHFQDACQAGCIRHLCPDLAECTGLDQMWCKPCDDMYGAAFWGAMRKARRDCWTEFRLYFYPPDKPFPNMKYDEPFHECFVNHTLQLCPQLGPKWYARFERERDNDGAHYGEFCGGNPPTCYHEETP